MELSVTPFSKEPALDPLFVVAKMTELLAVIPKIVAPINNDFLILLY
ncbi:hypothetical protein EHR_3032 (plasmid) [Enterococcus hirae ATCC 9790]|uniref:Uncharacterized protein n=1 Tax=Enterococcus hirae (strain ATCC 9790 / DSM 20160 / JCM 8729 / LMG 6399 / NBRC 3181 / NCIMB 6459 / NCDO 1258 / NCTC 12367 / WDCM 00089 / R) TaxID=768486 RepID=G0YP75_ENTHA|nr:hypothetical protein EHR_3032 [Enterococcus hirae ATCC 9790]